MTSDFLTLSINEIKLEHQAITTKIMKDQDISEKRAEMKALIVMFDEYRKLLECDQQFGEVL